MRIYNAGIQPVCPECMKIMMLSNTMSPKGYTVISCQTHSCINYEEEYVLALPFIEVTKKGE